MNHGENVLYFFVNNKQQTIVKTTVWFWTIKHAECLKRLSFPKDS